jgi:hypothetical protein
VFFLTAMLEIAGVASDLVVTVTICATQGTVPGGPAIDVEPVRSMYLET